MDALRYALSPRDVKEVLDTLPQGSTSESVLKRAYGEAIKRIRYQPPQLQALARCVLMWLTHAGCELRIPELQHPLAVRKSEDFDEDRIVDAEDMVSVCAGLVTIDSTTQVIRFVHYTTREFFEGEKIWFPTARMHVATTCLAYLLGSQSAHGPYDNDEELDLRLIQYPLLHFAVFEWVRLAANAEEDSWKVLALKLFAEKAKLLFITQIMYCRGRAPRSCFDFMQRVATSRLDRGAVSGEGFAC